MSTILSIRLLYEANYFYDHYDLWMNVMKEDPNLVSFAHKMATVLKPMAKLHNLRSNVLAFISFTTLLERKDVLENRDIQN